MFVTYDDNKGNLYALLVLLGYDIFVVVVYDLL